MKREILKLPFKYHQRDLKDDLGNEEKALNYFFRVSLTHVNLNFEFILGTVLILFSLKLVEKLILFTFLL